MNILVIVAICGMVSTQVSGQFRPVGQTAGRPSEISFNTNAVPVEGDGCYHYVKQVAGVCSNPNQCPEVIRDFQRGVHPQICSYRDYAPIVCCPQSTTQVTPAPPVQQTTTQRPAPTQSSIPSQSFSSTTRISEQKVSHSFYNLKINIILIFFLFVFLFYLVRSILETSNGEQCGWLLFPR